MAKRNDYITGREDGLLMALEIVKNEGVEALEKEIPTLEAEKENIENQLASGTLSSDEIIKASQRFGELGDIIDEKTMRWLELSEM